MRTLKALALVIIMGVLPACSVFHSPVNDRAPHMLVELPPPNFSDPRYKVVTTKVEELSCPPFTLGTQRREFKVTDMNTFERRFVIIMTEDHVNILSEKSDIHGMMHSWVQTAGDGREFNQYFESTYVPGYPDPCDMIYEARKYTQRVVSLPLTK